VKSQRDRALRIAMIGDRGIPARYSGFSTLVEEVSTRLVANYGMDVTVYCRSPYAEDHPVEFKGVRLVYLSAPGGKSFESLLHSQRSILHAAMRRYDLAFVVDPGNSPLTWPLALRRMPFVIHTDGMGWKREKWSEFQKRYYRWSEAVSARLATGLVCDSEAMRECYRETYGTESAYLPYGAIVGDPPKHGAPGHFGIEPGKYHLVVARLEPENNLAFIIREYKASKARLPLVYVGGARYESEYSRSIAAEAGNRVRCLGPLYDSDILNGLYRNCRTYIHGHEVGGTNPSLLRAMGMGAACVAMDVVFNREVLDDAGRFFTKEPGQLGSIIETLEADDADMAALGTRARERTRLRYRWDAVAAGYAEFFTHLVEARRSGTWIPKFPVPDVYHPESFQHAEPGAL
jgi:glycosyltransferase involved in cell wall biosynthesis